MKKKIGYGLLVLLLILIGAGIYGVRFFNNLWFAERPLYLSSTLEEESIEFEWVSQTFDDHHEPHAAMIIPVRLGNLPHQFYLQFDTGAPTSILYGNPLLSLDSLGFQINFTNREEDRLIESLDLSMADNLVNVKMISVLNDYGKHFSAMDTLVPITLGTIGADFMANRITAIDFKNKKIRLYNKRPAWMTQQVNFSPFNFQGRRFMFPAIINGKAETLFYDSGSSAFGLLTSKDRYDLYTDINTPEISYDGNRWGDPLTIYHKSSDFQMVMGGTTLPLKRVSYVGMYARWQKFMTPFAEIGGWLGNKPFIDHILILNTTGESAFAIVESGDQDYLSDK